MIFDGLNEALLFHILLGDCVDDVIDFKNKIVETWDEWEAQSKE